MRSYWLWQISQLLGLFGGEEIRSVPELRSAYPNIAAAYPKMGIDQLEEIYNRLKAGETILAPEKEKPMRKLRKSSLSVAEIRQLRSERQTLKEIGLAAGITQEAVLQLLIDRI